MAPSRGDDVESRRPGPRAPPTSPTLDRRRKHAASVLPGLYFGRLGLLNDLVSPVCTSRASSGCTFRDRSRTDQASRASALVRFLSIIRHDRRTITTALRWSNLRGALHTTARAEVGQNWIEERKYWGSLLPPLRRMDTQGGLGFRLRFFSDDDLDVLVESFEEAEEPIG